MNLPDGKLFCTAAFEYFNEKLISTKCNHLEIGVYHATSLKKLSVLHPNKKFYGIDPFIEDGHTSHESKVDKGKHLGLVREEAYRDLDAFPNVKIYEMTTSNFLRDELDSKKIDELNVGSILIDGSHHYEDVVLDCQIAMRLIGSKRGYIFFDDIHYEGVIQAIEEFEKEYKDRIFDKETLYPKYQCTAFRIN